MQGIEGRGRVRRWEEKTKGEEGHCEKGRSNFSLSREEEKGRDRRVIRRRNLPLSRREINAKRERERNTLFSFSLFS